MRRILALSSRGLSLNRISVLLGRRKSTSYYHVRKHYGRKISPLKIIDKPTEDLGEFIGAFATDGSFYADMKSYRYSVSIDLSDYQAEYAEKLSEIMQRVFGKSRGSGRTNDNTQFWLDCTAKKSTHYCDNFSGGEVTERTP